VVELTVTLVVVGLVLAATIPSFSSSLIAHRLDGSADAISSDLRLVRARAVAENTSYILAWYPSLGWYYTIRDENGNGQPDWGSEPYQGPYKFPKGITLRNSTKNPFATSWLVFFPNGSTNVGGGVELKDTKGRKLEVTVLQPSGAVHVSKTETAQS